MLLLLKRIFNLPLLFKNLGHYFKIECQIIEIKTLPHIFLLDLYMLRLEFLRIAVLAPVPSWTFLSSLFKPMFS